MSAPESMKAILQEAKKALITSEISERAYNTLNESITTNNISVSASRSLDFFTLHLADPNVLDLLSSFMM